MKLAPEEIKKKIFEIIEANVHQWQERPSGTLPRVMTSVNTEKMRNRLFSLFEAQLAKLASMSDEQVREEMVFILCPNLQRDYDSCGSCYLYEGDKRCGNPKIDQLCALFTARLQAQAEEMKRELDTEISARYYSPEAGCDVVAICERSYEAYWEKWVK